IYVEDPTTLVEGTAIRRREEGFISVSSRFGDRISSTLGLNLASDHYDWGLRRDGEIPPTEPGSTFLSPRASVAWRVCSWATTRVALGVLRQPVFLNYLDETRSEAVLGRRREAREAVAGVEISRGGYHIQVDGYTRRDRGVGVPVQDLSDLPPVPLDEGEAWGVEVLARTPTWTRFDAWIGYARSHAAWTTDHGDVPRSFDQPHAATASVNARWLASVNLNATVRYHTGNAYTETEWVSLGGPRFWAKRYGPFMGSRYPDYFRLDFRATQPLPFGSPGSVVFLDLVNATGRSNVYYYWWTFDELPAGGAEPRRTYTELFPRLPYLGFTVIF
ncbi:MAG TPA: TonB-dependent receptor, partial [Candidatus Eisenbacteria bacterium]|nr:TonB-dependent receptor [Candidatus Eisenbacteria bacterium]